jgi:hypothetical protein
MDLEEELSIVSSTLQATQQQLQETKDKLKATQETNAQLQSQLDAAMQEMKEKLQSQGEDMNANLKRQGEKTLKLEEQWKQLQMQLAQLHNNQENTPSIPRKKQDTIITPNGGMTQAPTVYPYRYPSPQSYYGHERPQYPLRPTGSTQFYNNNSVGPIPQYLRAYYNHHHWANAGHSDPRFTTQNSNNDNVAQGENLQGAPQEGASVG